MLLPVLLPWAPRSPGGNRGTTRLTLWRIAPILPGYDARLVFPDAGARGFHDQWRRGQKDLALEYATAGISVDCWNGWTEGYAIPPSREEGDVGLRGVRDVVDAARQAAGE